MSLNEYKLSCELLGHSLDVRAVAECNNSIVSGSRDKSAKIWNPEGIAYVEGVTLRDHTNFIAAICVLGNGELICTSSNDSKICVYAPGSTVPVTTLKGHTSAVSCLTAGFEQNSLVSGSWDKSVRVWSIAGFGPSASISLIGHEAAVWAVLTLSTGYYVTGSADQSIFFWNKNGEKVKVLKGHTDCVRALVEIGRGGLISCGNDAVIKIWSEDGECIKELHGHENYIYTMALNKAIGDDVIVTGSEDSTIRMWNSKGVLGDALTLPAQSVWSVTCLRNGDIVTGSSDAIVRVFTKDPTRYADEKMLKSFATAVQQRKLDTQTELGGMKVSELPGPEALIREGTVGQRKIIRNELGKIMCYEWIDNEWVCLGDVTGASSSGKVLYEGIEYDHVFNVDISDSQPPIKLPYNSGDDPWVAAQKFIHKHSLPQDYLEQVANFIVENTEKAARPPPDPSSSGYGYLDPFTGEARYVPGSASNSNTGNMYDPFTGASGYHPAESGPSRTTEFVINPTAATARVAHFPHYRWTFFDACDTIKVINKLKEFNSQIEDEKLRVSTEQLDDLQKLTQRAPKDYANQVQTIKQLFQWPKNFLFPVLDIVRLAVRHERLCRVLITDEIGNRLVETCSDSAANQLMTTRCYANMFNHDMGKAHVHQRFPDIVRALCKTKQGSANLQIAIASLYLNMSIAQLDVDLDDICRVAGDGAVNLLKWIDDLEAYYRTYVALGNLAYIKGNGAITCAQILSTNAVIDKIRDFMSAKLPNGFEKLNEVAQDLVSKITA